MSWLGALFGIRRVRPAEISAREQALLALREAEEALDRLVVESRAQTRGLVLGRAVNARRDVLRARHELGDCP